MVRTVSGIWRLVDFFRVSACWILFWSSRDPYSSRFLSWFCWSSKYVWKFFTCLCMYPVYAKLILWVVMVSLELTLE